MQMQLWKGFVVSPLRIMGAGVGRFYIPASECIWCINIMAINEYIIGYTVQKLLGEWSLERRKLYLLSDNVVHPITVDPSGGSRPAFMQSECVSIFENSVIEHDYGSSEQSELVSVPLWPQLAPLQQYVYSQVGHVMPAGHAIVSVSRVCSGVLYRSYTSGAGKAADPAAFCRSQWKLLGYDIADAWLLSGLVNCGYTHSHRMLLKHYIAHLNQNHLFDDPAVAARYAKETNVRVAEHAPFFVYGLYLLASSVMTE